jgi:hypothetical protein
MPLFKVWNREKTLWKAVVASSFINLFQKGTFSYYLSNKIPEPCTLNFLTCNVGHVGGQMWFGTKEYFIIRLWEATKPASVGEQHCLVCPERLVASQE